MPFVEFKYVSGISTYSKFQNRIALFHEITKFENKMFSSTKLEWTIYFISNEVIVNAKKGSSS